MTSYQEPPYQGPPYQEPPYQGPPYQEPAYQEPAYQEPAYQEPAPAEPQPRAQTQQQAQPQAQAQAQPQPQPQPQPQHGVPESAGPQYGVPQHAAPQPGAPQHAAPQFPAPQSPTPQPLAPRSAGPQHAGPQPGAGWEPQPALQPVPPPQIGAAWETREARASAPGEPGRAGMPPWPPQEPLPVRERAAELTGAPVRLDSAAFHGDPTALYQALRRAHGPVAPVLLDGDLPAWLVLGYREVHYVSANPALFGRDSRRWHSWARVPADWPLLPYVAHTSSVVFTEGTEHLRRAGAIADVLAAVDQFELRLAAERAADAAVDAFAGAGRAELVREYADLVPLRVMAGLLGLRDDETAELERDLALAFDDAPDAAHAYARIRNTMEMVLERARRRPGPEVPTRLLVHPAGLKDEEIVQDLLSILVVGRQPTAQWIGNTLRLMLTDDRFAVTLSGGRRSVGQALTEVLWTETPAQNIVGRWAVRDTQLGGRLIRRGDCLVLGLAAANTDPAVCPYAVGTTVPGAVGNQAHLSFGHGEHRCPAPAPEIAEIVAKAAVEVLLDRLPDLRPAVPTAELAWRPSLWLRGPAALPVEFTPV